MVNEIFQYLQFDTEGKVFALAILEGDRVTEWDVEWCWRDQTYYTHSSGSSKFKGQLDNGVPYLWVPVGKEFDIWNIAQGGNTVWCDVCQDNLPFDEDRPCEHLVWDEAEGDFKQIKIPEEEQATFEKPLCDCGGAHERQASAQKWRAYDLFKCAKCGLTWVKHLPPVAPKVGARVLVVKDLRPWWQRLFHNLSGLEGVIARVETLQAKNEDGTRETLSEHYPIIQVGKYELGGIECWWEPLEGGTGA